MTIDYINWVKPEFENKGENGAYKTDALFLEFNRVPEKRPPVYTFREHEQEYEGRILPSAYQVILYSQNEYDAAMRLVGSYRHWERLKQAPRVYHKGLPFKAVLTIEIALRDMKMRIESEAKKVIYSQMQSGQISAARTILAEEGEENKKANKKKEKQNKEKASKIPANPSVTDILARFKK